MTTTPIEGTDMNGSCAVDRSCGPDTGCGCGSPAETEVAASTARRTGVVAAVLAVLCAAACLAVPLALGGIAAVTGALAGEWLLVAGGVVVAGAVAAVMWRRRGGTPC
jgi:hypothetical protein